MLRNAEISGIDHVAKRRRQGRASIRWSVDPYPRPGDVLTRTAFGRIAHESNRVTNQIVAIVLSILQSTASEEKTPGMEDMPLGGQGHPD